MAAGPVQVRHVVNRQTFSASLNLVPLSSKGIMTQWTKIKERESHETTKTAKLKSVPHQPSHVANRSDCTPTSIPQGPLGSSPEGLPFLTVVPPSMTNQSISRLQNCPQLRTTGFLGHDFMTMLPTDPLSRAGSKYTALS